MQSSTLFLNPSLNFPPKSPLFPPSKRFIVDGVLYRQRTASLSGFRVQSEMGCSSSGGDGFQTLTEYVGKGGADVGDDLVVLLSHLQYACKRIAAVVASPFNLKLGKQMGIDGVGESTAGRDAPKPLDLVSHYVDIAILSKNNLLSGKRVCEISPYKTLVPFKDVKQWIPLKLDSTEFDPFSEDSDSLSSQVPSTSNTPSHVLPSLPLHYTRRIRTDHSAGTDTLLSGTPEAPSSPMVHQAPSEIVDPPLRQSIRILIRNQGILGKMEFAVIIPLCDTCGARVISREPQSSGFLIGNEIILSSLRNSGKVAVMASEEDDIPVWLSDDGPFVVVTDPLDGSRNIDASIPTGTIFGIYNRLVELDHLPKEEKAQLNSLQSGTRLVAAGYVLYSSATILCASFGSGTHAFTLDHSTGDFVLTHPSIKIPPRGQIYSVNDARYFDWPDGLRRYIDTVRRGKGKYPKKYSARYICSLVADFHRTLMYGGVAMNPRDHLRLVYEANPLTFLVEQAGGRGSDGKSRILSLQPVKLHQRLPLFLGSLEDMEELESYGNIQQKVNPGYEV
ncbi:hypothetical protein HHK36_009602 [Tetracentron sinense]|uniref:fructose-bisphosphatase n=1 Tax=Tetracentron sinense TaxID=13715 RepID=A0A834ZBZ5_TETSI|nr:hypothetical protein HHK36_009602 [Tetracentron sinense]